MEAELLLLGLGGKVSAAAASSALDASSSAGTRWRQRLGPATLRVRASALQWRHSLATSTDQKKPPYQRCAAAELWRGDAEDGKMGFEKEVIEVGTGPKPVKGQKPQGHKDHVLQPHKDWSTETYPSHCTGYGKDGDLSKKFWSTKDPGQQPFAFNIGLGSVIKGWDEGVMTMKIGEVARITCTPDYAYGSGGFKAWGIQPNSTLIFEIEALSAE